MKKILFTVLFLWGASLSAQEILPLSEVKAGMKGTCVTVVRGDSLVSFDVEILDVLKNVSPKRNLILARFTGAEVEKTGIAKGMSGSPVYINGKLIGALAYTWGYLKEAIGGIQPIEEMLPALERRQNKEPASPLRFIPVDEKLASELKVTFPSRSVEKIRDFRPIAVPLSISGFSSNVFSFFQDKFKTLGFDVIQGSGGGQAPASGNRELNPGDAVAIPMVTGDANIAAVGTVTYRDKNQVLIFGHPFMERGFMEMPLAKAIVHYVLPSLEISWKFASATDIVGTAYNDQETAVAGEMGKFPQMLPVAIQYESGGKAEKFRYEMVRDPLFFPNLFAGVLMSSVYSKEAKMSEGSFQFEYRLKVKNIVTEESRELVLKDFLIGSNESALYQALFKMIQPIQYLIYNWFTEIKLESIEVFIKKIPRFQIALIEKAVILNDHVKEGETLKLRVYIRLYQGGYETREIEFPIPKNMNTDIAWVAISSAKLENLSYASQYSPVFVPKSLDQLYEILSVNSSFDTLAVWLDIPQNGAVVDGHFLPNLPVSKLANYAFRERGNSFLRSRRNLRYIQTNYLMAGFLYVPVVIER